jgi:hypothetical protein
VDQEQLDAELVSFTAEKEDQLFSWDVAAEQADSLRDHFESEGWEVTIAVGDGPRRRRLPRMVIESHWR